MKKGETMSKTYTWFSMVGGRVWRLTLSPRGGMKHGLEKFINFCNKTGSDCGNAKSILRGISSVLSNSCRQKVSNSCRISLFPTPAESRFLPP